uniref:Uncharacterized protein n=1 Tax=Siphoviridae sp. ctqwO1 TaxID=2826472 RepID=A0A8S5QNV1_9CAUD|nr:MAG TPA: hypothetical protein [Siphoviridae sp. ctqwO1]
MPFYSSSHFRKILRFFIDKLRKIFYIKSVTNII